jgi:multidrug efflux system outer membrane protein
LSKLFSGPARVWSYTGSITGPLFSFGAVSGQVAQAEALQTAALENYQLSIRNAFADVENALIANQKLQEQLAAQTRLVAALQQYTELANLQYKGGYTSYSTVLQAEQALFPAELNLVAIRAQMFTSSVNIYKAMGGGWVAEADAMTGNTPTPPPESALPPPPF